LANLRTRFYDPALGRFTSADSIIPGGVQGLDRYAYVNNSPVNFTDPSGHNCSDPEKGACENNNGGTINGTENGGGGPNNGGGGGPSNGGGGPNNGGGGPSNGGGGGEENNEPNLCSFYSGACNNGNSGKGGNLLQIPDPSPNNDANCWQHDFGEGGYGCAIHVDQTLNNAYSFWNGIYGVAVTATLTLAGIGGGLLCGGAAEICSPVFGLVGLVVGGITVVDLNQIQNRFNTAALNPNQTVTIGRMPMVDGNPDSGYMYVGTGQADIKVVDNVFSQFYLKTVLWLNNAPTP